MEQLAERVAAAEPGAAPDRLQPAFVPPYPFRQRLSSNARRRRDNLENILFSGWDGLLRTLVVGVLAYVALVVFLRISGKRTLSKMSAFDLVVTVALGSTLATVLLSKDVTLAGEALAFALLIGLQFAVTWSNVRARWVRQWVTGEPVILLYRGELLPATLRRARVTEDEVRAAVRSAGMPYKGNRHPSGTPTMPPISSLLVKLLSVVGMANIVMERASYSRRQSRCARSALIT